MRTAKSCGPDAPTLASSLWNSIPQATVANKPGHKSAKETVKTIAQGMPADSVEPGVTTTRAYYHTTRGCGRIGRPAFPAPSVVRGREVQSKTRAKHAARSRS